MRLLPDVGYGWRGKHHEKMITDEINETQATLMAYVSFIHGLVDRGVYGRYINHKITEDNKKSQRIEKSKIHLPVIKSSISPCSLLPLLDNLSPAEEFFQRWFAPFDLLMIVYNIPLSFAFHWSRKFLRYNIDKEIC